MFIVLNMMITFYYYYFQETYNNRFRERYGDDILTHPEFDPDLWMEVGSLGGPDKNRVYGLSNTTADNLRSTRSVSTVGSSQSKKFVVLQQHTLSSPKNTITSQRSMHNSKHLMHNKKQNKERSLSKSKRLKHNKKRLMNNKKRLMNNFAK